MDKGLKGVRRLVFEKATLKSSSSIARVLLPCWGTTSQASLIGWILPFLQFLTFIWSNDDFIFCDVDRMGLFHVFTEGIFTGSGAINKITDGWIPFSCFSLRVLLLCMLAHCHGLLGHLNRSEPSLMFTPVLSLRWQVKKCLLWQKA